MVASCVGVVGVSGTGLVEIKLGAGLVEPGGVPVGNTKD